MGENMYKYCVLILTHSKGKFERISFSKFLEEEKQSGGKFAELVEKVNGRVVAVENSFEECQQNCLMERLAKAVNENNGGAFSSKIFVVAQKNIEKENKDRERKFNELGNQLLMKVNLDDFCYCLLNSFTLEVDKLKFLKVYFRENAREIYKKAKLDNLNFINIEIAIKHLEEFASDNECIIAKYVKLTSERIVQYGKIQSKHQCQKIVIDHIRAFLSSSSKKGLLGMQNNFRLPDNQLQSVLDNLMAKGIEFDQSHVDMFLTKILRKTTEVLQKIKIENDTDANLKQKIVDMLDVELENLKKILKTEEIIHKCIPELTEQLSLNDLEKLIVAIRDKNDVEIESFLNMCIMKCFNDKRDISIQQICMAHFKRNMNFIIDIIVTLRSVKKIRDDKNKKRIEERNVNERLLLISNIIDKRLKRFLLGRSVEQLKDINLKLSKNEIPENIREEILEHLFKEKKMTFDVHSINEEILEQLQIKRKILTDLIEKTASCFPMTCSVITRGNVKTLVSLLKVGDEVLVYDYKGNLKYESVFLLSHANKEIHAMYVKITTQKGKVLLISPNHYLPINNIDNIVPAKEASVGNTIFSLTDGNLTPDMIATVSYKMCKGAYCPMTLTGTIVVDHVAASCYTTFVSPSYAQMMLFPLRTMFHYLPKSVFHRLLPYDTAEGMPIILAKFREAIISVRSFFKCLKDQFCRADVQQRISISTNDKN